MEYAWNTCICIPKRGRIHVEYTYSKPFATYSPSRRDAPLGIVQHFQLHFQHLASVCRCPVSALVWEGPGSGGAFVGVSTGVLPLLIIFERE